MTDLAEVITLDASHPIADATDTTPAMSVQRMPPPAALMVGERRAEDGGVVLVATGYTPESGPARPGSEAETPAEGSPRSEAPQAQPPQAGVNRHPDWVPR